jgi:hypothetical protein
MKNDKADTTHKDSKPEDKNFLYRLWNDSKKEMSSARFWIELFALIGLFFYVSETSRTNDLTKTAINNAQENFRLDQAPVVLVTPDPPKVEVNEPLIWNLRYSNYGRSPARNLRTCATAGYGTNPSMVRVPKRDQCEKMLTFRSITVLPQGLPGYTSVVSADLLREADVSTIKTYDGGAIAIGSCRMRMLLGILMKAFFAFIVCAPGR